MAYPPAKPTYADFKERDCTDHPEKWLAMVCATCKDMFVCLTCISSKHRGHIFIEIEEYLLIKDHLLNKLTLEVITKSKRLDVRIQRVQRAKVDNKKNSSEMITFIEDRAKSMKDEIDRISNDYVSQCRAVEQNNDNLLVHLEDRMSKHFNDLKDISNHSRNVLDTENFMEFLTVENKLKFQNDRMYDKFPKLWKTGVVMSDKQTRIMTQFGYMDKSDWVPDGCEWGGEKEELDVSGEISPFKVELLSTFMTQQQKQVHAVCPIDNGQAWLACTASNQAELRNKKGDISGVMQTKEGVRINDIVHSMERSRTLCCAQGSVRKILPYGKYQLMFPTDFYSSSICEAFEDDHILVCHDEKGRILKYNSKGKVKQTIANDQDGWKLFTWPRKIRVNKRNGDLAIIEESPPRHVAVFNVKNEELCRYYGGKPAPDETKTEISNRDEEDAFHPRDICFDRNGDIIIADHGKKAIIVIDKDGREKRTIWRDEIPPSSLGIQPNGQLWIGFLSGAIKIVRYLEN